MDGVDRRSAFAENWSTAHAKRGETAGSERAPLLARGIAATAASIFLSNGMDDASQHTNCPSETGLPELLIGPGSFSNLSCCCFSMLQLSTPALPSWPCLGFRRRAREVLLLHVKYSPALPSRLQHVKSSGISNFPRGFSLFEGVDILDGRQRRKHSQRAQPA